MASSTVPAAEVAAFRQFNRSYTRFLGTLSDQYLRTAFSLAEGRVLYELSTHPEALASEVMDALGLDAGYLSRILAKFLRRGLVARSRSRHDRRAANLRLTAKGRVAIGTLNRRADRQATEVLARLSAHERQLLTHAFQTVENSMLGSPAPAMEVTVRAPRSGDMGTIVALEGAGYAAQFGWDATFEALVARITADFIEQFEPGRDCCWIAESEGRHLGHVFLVRHRERPGVAKLRLLYVDPTARGLGVGRRLVAECLQFARAAGYERVTLWTQSILTAAHKIYAAEGFQLVKEEPHHSFGKDLVGQTWELKFHPGSEHRGASRSPRLH